jgi:hypothetical protein
MVDAARTCLFGLALLACGGKSSKIDANGDDDGSLGGSSSARGGRSGTGGAPTGGTTGGNPVGGSAGRGGTAGTSFGGASGSGSGGVAGVACEAMSPTSISGTVRDPAGLMPVYNVLVYVPTEPLPDLPVGISCDVCPVVIPTPYSTALTDTAGNFRVLAPPGENVPLVFQIGKWRRTITVPFVLPCVTTGLPSEATHLPSSQGEGNIPRIAVVTGVEDSTECFLRRLGIADVEFTTATGGGAVNLYVGCDAGSGTGADHFTPMLGGATFPPASTLFSDPGLLASYDMVFLGCEGGTCESDKAPYRENIEAYADQGGLLFLAHHQSYWLRNGSAAWQGLASFREGDAGTISALPASVDRSFPKGEALATWLVDAGVSAVFGELVIGKVATSIESVTPPTQRWLYGPLEPDAVDEDIFSLTARTPVAAPEHLQCGRIIFNDFHAMAGAFDSPDVSRSEIPFPNGCISGPHTAQEATLEFHLFDVPSCVQSDIGPPIPPQ